MSAPGRLPEDLAAEQAYLAELRAQRATSERQSTEQRRALLAAQGLLETPAGASTVEQAAPGAVSMDGGTPRAIPGTIAPEVLASISPELLAQLPAELQRAAAAAQQSSSAPANLPSIERPEPAIAELGLTDEQLASREAAVLAQVQAELAEADSPLLGQRSRSPFDIAPIRVLDNLLGAIFGRKQTW